MSWSIYVVGTPEGIEKEIERQSANYSGLSKEEFDDAKDHLIALVKQNFGNGKRVVRLHASGHGTRVNDKDVNRICKVMIEEVGELVT